MNFYGCNEFWTKYSLFGSNETVAFTFVVGDWAYVAVLKLWRVMRTAIQRNNVVVLDFRICICNSFHFNLYYFDSPSSIPLFWSVIRSWFNIPDEFYFLDRHDLALYLLKSFYDQTDITPYIWIRYDLKGGILGSCQKSILKNSIFVTYRNPLSPF